MTPPCYIQESFTEEEQVVLEEQPELTEPETPVMVKVEGAVNSVSEEEEEAEVKEEIAEEPFLNENLFDGTLITKVFDEEEVFVNEVTIEDGTIKEEPLQISQE